MPIDRKAGHAEGVTEDDICRLPADAREGDERVHVGRHRPAVRLDEGGGHPDQRFRFRAEKAGRVNLLLERSRRRPGERPGVRIPFEQGGRDEVDARIGRLG